MGIQTCSHKHTPGRDRRPLEEKDRFGPVKNTGEGQNQRKETKKKQKKNPKKGKTPM